MQIIRLQERPRHGRLSSVRAVTLPGQAAAHHGVDGHAARDLHGTRVRTAVDEDAKNHFG
ncbi:hypothetical protein GCM10027452_08110 [Micromonospora halotolerans]